MFDFIAWCIGCLGRPAPDVIEATDIAKAAQDRFNAVGADVGTLKRQLGYYWRARVMNHLFPTDPYWVESVRSWSGILGYID